MSKSLVERLTKYWTGIALSCHPLDPTWQYERIVRQIVEDAIKLDRKERAKKKRAKK